MCSTASEGWWATPGIPGITDSYATGPVSGEAGGNYIGGLIGSSLGTFADSYWDTGASGQSDSDGGTGQTTSDKQQAVGMMMETISNTGAVPGEVSADAGYYSAKAVGDLHALGVDPFIAPEQTRHGGVVPLAPRGRIPRHLSPRDRMRRKLQTRRGRKRYALRMETVEPVFGQIKAGRGFRQFLLRGLEKVNGEWSLICTGHNPESSSGQALLKLFRFGLPAYTGGPKPGRRTVHPFHWLRSIPPVSQPTTSPSIP